MDVNRGFADAALLDVLPDGAVLADATGRVVAMNAVAGKLLGVRGGVGKQLQEVVTLQDRGGTTWYSCAEPYGGPSIRSGLPEQSWFASDGAEVLVTTRIERERFGGPVRGVAISLRSARGRARLDRERSDLVATVAHELRSPLTGVKGFVSTLLAKWDRLNDEQKKLMLETVNSDADRLTRLIAELLDVARIDTGRLPLHTRPVAFAEVVERVITSVRAGSPREIVFDCDPDLGTVFADSDKLTQVVTNLVENAVRHGDGLVRLTARPLPATAAFPGVEMHIDDEGIGISPDIRSRVFTKFWKHGTRGGSGLGMYIVHGLITAHGGTVEIGAAPGGGARLTIRWPEHDRRERNS